jgi:hypothetical protein
MEIAFLIVRGGKAVAAGTGWRRASPATSIITVIGQAGEKNLAEGERLPYHWGRWPHSWEIIPVFGWLQPKCPVGKDEKTWVEDRFRWLAGEFGLERLRKAPVILPTDEYFPDPYDGGKKGAKALFRRTCGYLKVNPESVALKIYEGKFTPGADGLAHGSAGLYEAGGLDPLLRASYAEDDDEGGGRWFADSDKAVIRLEKSNLGDPMAVVGVLAHELGHVLLLGEGRVNEGDEDHEQLTDLLTVFLGLGIFTANSRVRSYRGGLKGQGYLDQRAFGWALALFARVRGEEHPAWAKYLSLDVRTYCKRGLRYLLKTRDTDFDPA